MDSGEYLRAYIVNSVENAILEQWELDISVPSSTSVFSLNMAVAVSIEHYPLLEKLLDVNLSNPVSGQVLKWDGSEWTNAVDSASGLISGEGTGFDSIENIIASYDSGTRTVILMGGFKAY